MADQSAAQHLAALIAFGQAKFEASLPAYARRQEGQQEPSELSYNITLSDDVQRNLCLTCPLADCVDLADIRCPIHVAQLEAWRNQNHRRARHV